MPALPDSVQTLIFRMIPTIDALEILVFRHARSAAPFARRL